MLIVLCIFFPMAFKLRKQILKKQHEISLIKQDNQAEKAKKYENIVRSEIWHHFRKLILVYIIGGTVFVILILAFLVTALVIVPWRAKLNYLKLRVIL